MPNRCYSRKFLTHPTFALLMFVVATMIGCQNREATQKLPPPEVTVATPKVQEVREYERFTGRTESVANVELRARVSGYLTKVLFKPGTEMKKGDALFEIDDRSYKASLDQMAAEVKQSEARVVRLNADFARAGKLLATKSISQEDYDKIAGDRAEAVATVESSKARFQAADLDYKFTKIHSPIDGRIGDRLVDEGNLIVGGQGNTTLLTTIVAVDPIDVTFDLDENTLQRLQQAARDGKIALKNAAKAIPVELGLPIHKTEYPLTGEVDFVNNQVNPKTGTIRVKAIVPNPMPKVGDRVLTPGMFVRIRVPIGAPRKAITVPESALGTDQGQRYLYAVNDKKEAIRLEATVGALQDGYRVIEQVQRAEDAKGRELRPDERVIVKGIQRVRPGLVVEPKAN